MSARSPQCLGSAPTSHARHEPEAQTPHPGTVRQRVRHRRRRGALHPAALVALLVAALGTAGAEGAVIQVTTPNDEFNNGAAGCSLREAVQTANTNANFGGCAHVGSFAAGDDADIILVPAEDPGYPLARDGKDEDANATSDLDITSNITIKGAGAGTTPIFLCGSCEGRIIHVLSGNNVTIQDVTLKLGKLPFGRAGAGLRTEPGTTVTLTRVTIGLNEADGNAGGVLNRGTMTINDSAIGNNLTLNSIEGGGGIFNDDGATLVLNDSRVLNNTSFGSDGFGGGGGIYNDSGATLTLDNTTVDGNIADDDNNTDVQVADGGGIYSLGALTLIQSTISNNEARGNNAEGGGIFYGGSTPMIIDHSLISGNIAVRDGDLVADVPRGGGISASKLLLTNSILRNNTADTGGQGGGLFMFDGTVRNTTISGNRSLGVFGVLDSGVGGGLVVRGEAFLVNTTISNNEAEEDGGGIFVEAGGVLDVSSSTITGNESNSDGFGGGGAGGVFLSESGIFGADGALTMRNSVLAGNLENGIGSKDDCDGLIVLAGHNLIGNTNGCTLIGINGSDQIGLSAKLGALADNGGPDVGASTSALIVPMLTHVPASDSPLVDAGNPAGCGGVGNEILATDQRGLTRTVDGPDPDNVKVCDIGAVERGGTVPPNVIYSNSYE